MSPPALRWRVASSYERYSNNIGYRWLPLATKSCYSVLKTSVWYNQMQKAQDLLDLTRKQPRVHTPLPEEVFNRLEEIANDDSRPVANMASALIQAAIELIDKQGFQLVGGKLRKVTIQTEETENVQ